MPYFFGFNALYFLLRPASSREIQHRACPGLYIAQCTRIWHELVSVKERSVVPSTRMHLGLSEISGNTGIVTKLAHFNNSGVEFTSVGVVNLLHI